MSNTHLTVPGSNAKLMVAPPRINLRRAKSYNANDQAPLSATSSTFNFNHLLFSPPPSPALPPLVPRRKRAASDLLRKPTPSRLLRLGVWTTILFSTLYVLAFALLNQDAMATVRSHLGSETFDMVALDAVPDFPTPIVTTDAKGQARWTFFVPPTYSFPLASDQYAAMGRHCREASAQVQDMHRKSPLSDKTLLKHDAPEAYFMDVAEAEKSGLLPEPPRKARWTRHGLGHFVGLDDAAGASSDGKNAYQQHQLLPICQSSMTYVLDNTDAGMGNELMMLWVFYGIAKQEGRAFFIDDSRWAYGAYSDIFQPPPPPMCRPPPRHHMVPCPFQARHLVVSGASADDVAPPLMAKYRRHNGTGDRVRDVWNLAHAGYEALFRINKDDGAYVESRIGELRSRSRKGITAPDAPVIGLHVRRGDLHPIEYQYRDTYIPAEVFHDKAAQLAAATVRTGTGDESAGGRPGDLIMVLASDDPTMQNQADFATAVPAQQRIRLASNDQGKPQHLNDMIHRFVEEASGWEGGFFAPIFWNLGKERRNNAANAPGGVDVGGGDATAPVPEQTLKLRSLLGRAYVMDLAVLARASDGIVCAVSAMGCRLLGAMMDWDKGVGGNGWVNVDGHYGWTALDGW
ncbi:hypothetical protein GMORB2_6088 [Geosmithia morbida]|uniref:Uncharacterized protein n=1 Tax=Geosmithia morbida TaxID=1094350 RepID=A0A9P4YVP3_9HYPO|nr:uncharacterized protein GMORB2_6088 [Geosmithia morbida]KAF4123387.1 hypothetical protein GMORB2_6088 [Geosmithia morbida]